MRMQPLWQLTILLSSCLLCCSCHVSFDFNISSGQEDLAGMDEELTAPGIARSLAKSRSEIIGEIHYRLHFQIDDSERFRGHLNADIELKISPKDLILDFRGKSIEELKVNGNATGYAQINNHLVVPGKHLRRGKNSFEISWTGSSGAAGQGLIKVSDRDDGSTYVYTLNVPADGHALFPCFDQPDLKATFSLTVDAPRNWNVIANAPLAKRNTLESTLSHFEFKSTQKISTYLFAFAAGPFVQVKTNENGREISFYGRKSQQALVEQHAEEVLRLHRASLKFLEDWFEVPYPFQKFDFVCVPDFPFSGMEHPGCIFYGETPMLFRSEVTRLREAGRADLIAHETAHMWFGDYVTMPWFDDVWLKEGFATYMAHKVLENTFDGIDHELNFYLRNYPSALDVDITSGSTPIRQALANMQDAKSQYGPIIYRKGPAVLRALEYTVGKAAFKKGTQLFLEKYAFASGSWDDLRKSFEEAWDKGSLETFGEAWIKGAGVPHVTTEIVKNKEGKLALGIYQTSIGGEEWRWPLALEVCWEGQDGRLVNSRLAFETENALILTDNIRPGFSFANYNNRAYGRFTLDPLARQIVLEDFGRFYDPLLRTMIWEALWADVEDATLSPKDYLSFARNHLFLEKDQRLLSTVLGRMQTIMSRYLSATQREQLAPLIEGDLLERIFDAKFDRSLRLLMFRRFSSLVHSRGSRDVLVKWVQNESAPPGILMSKRDRWRALVRLTLLGDDRSKELLATMSKEDEGDEGRRRVFEVECAMPDPVMKQKLFQRFRHDKELPERWVQDGARIFFAAEQANLTNKYLGAAMKQLDWIKKNRKIFFLSAWLEAVVRSRLDDDSATTVWDYVESPQVAQDIKKKILVPLGHMERTIRIRKSFAHN